MANWKKVIVSGSSAQLNQLSVDTSVNITGSLNASSSVFLKGLTNASQATILSIDAATGQLFYQGTGSFTANSASYALSASYASNASTADSATSASRATSAASADNATSASYALNATSASRAISAASADSATSASYALSSSYALNASTANSATSASRATSAASADNATSASYALNATSASRATSAASADNATSASYALSSSYALNASTADSATSASRATSAASADNATSASYALNATSASFAQSGNGAFSGSFSGSFQGNGSGLTDVPASGIVGLQLNQIGSGSVTSSIAPDLGFRVNTNSQITGSLIVTGNINTGGSVISTVAGSSLTGSFTGSFAGNFVGTANLPDLTQGAGVTAFTYDGSTTATVAVSGASTLSATNVPKWTGNAFANSSITDAANVTINNAGGVYIQGGGIDVSGSSTFHDNVVMQGNLTVQGTASFQNVDNLAVKDQFILLNSGSSTFQDSGIVINTGNAQNSGSAFFLETSGTTTGTNGLYGRFAVGINVLPDATSATAAEYTNTTVISGSAPGNAVPQFGGTGLGQGNTWVDTSTSDIWIYA